MFKYMVMASSKLCRVCIAQNVCDNFCFLANTRPILRQTSSKPHLCESAQTVDETSASKRTDHFDSEHEKHERVVSAIDIFTELVCDFFCFAANTSCVLMKLASELHICESAPTVKQWETSQNSRKHIHRQSTMTFKHGKHRRVVSMMNISARAQS